MYSEMFLFLNLFSIANKKRYPHITTGISYAVTLIWDPCTVQSRHLNGCLNTITFKRPGICRIKHWFVWFVREDHIPCVA